MYLPLINDESAAVDFARQREASYQTFILCNMINIFIASLILLLLNLPKDS